jgi:GGDEF domain-containing protein
MHVLAIAFWGAFFGTVALMLAGGLVAFVQSHHRVALAAGITGLLSAIYVGSSLHLLPADHPLLEARLMAAASIFSASMLRLMLLVDLGHFRKASRRRQILAAATAIGGAAIVLTWFLAATQALIVGNVVTFGLSAWVMVDAVRSARRGDRRAWLGVMALGCMLVALVGLGWIGFDAAAVPWPVHAVSAVAAMAYLVCIGSMLWLRYSYLIEVREVMAHGPRYDPVTRMQSNAGTGHMVDEAFRRQRQNPATPVVLIAVSIGNLYALENLHGRAALNHALFVMASRLRRCVPADMDMGRMFDDGFLVVGRSVRDLDDQVKLGRVLAERLTRPLALRTPAGEGQEEGRTEWAAQVGVGLLATGASASPGTIVGKVRDMSRTAWSFSSRVAWLDQAADAIAEVPVLQPAQ